MSNNVFSGNDGLSEFLNPSNHVTPLIELPVSLNPYFSDNVHIYIKMQSFLPLMNIKSLASYNMLAQAEINKDKTSLVESSSGNTALSVTILGRNRGAKKTRAIISSEVGIGKLQQLLLAGTEIQVNKEPICPNPHDMNSGIYMAKQMSKKKDWLNLNQYANPANPEIHNQETAAQIYKQLKGDVAIFCSSLGTTGTMVGSAKFFKAKNKNIFTLGVVRKPNNAVPGPRTLGLLKMIDFDWQSACDDIIAAGTVESYKSSLDLFRQGIMAGPSTGLNFIGLLKYIKKLKALKKLDKLRNAQGQINAVFVCCDTPFLYMSDYFKILPRSCFPKILNEDLLKDKIKFIKNRSEKLNIEVTAKQMFAKCFKGDKKSIWSNLENNKKVSLKNNCEIIDLRSDVLFSDAHIPCSIRIEEASLLEDINKYMADWEGKKFFFLCQYGELSYHYAKIFAEKGIKAYCLVEGFAKWSELNLPRSSYNCFISSKYNK